MSLGTWAKENPILAIVAIVFGAGILTTGMVFGTGLLIVLAAEAPFVLLVLLFVALLAVGLAVRSGLALGGEDEEDEELDPLTELERRYVRGEITEEEFEHRLSTLLDAEERAGRDAELEAGHEYALETER
ncbi:SHOCT domain-containing protein [Halalkalicoccus tibetensis]|uniref:SHOCT domain-containing protein n=1 Tax=Halalkalicoccus tibetensis TaxID=175632 RepID=A0ABD5V2A4_9EURY